MTTQNRDHLKCTHCQGKMERGTAPFHIDRKSYHLLLDAVPAWVCSQCGEAFFEESEVDAIQEVICSVDKKVDKLAVTA
jgi:YgiT-type zinc finger domain-containing protein